MNNTERIAEIRERCETATPGAWHSTKLSGKYGVLDGVDGRDGETFVARLVFKRKDAEFIAHAREDIPYLLSEVNNRDKEIERLRDLLAERNVLLDKQDAELEQKTRELERYRLSWERSLVSITANKPCWACERRHNCDSFDKNECYETGNRFWRLDAKLFINRTKAEAALSAEGVSE